MTFLQSNQKINPANSFLYLLLSLLIHIIFIYFVNLPKINITVPQYKEIELKLEQEIKEVDIAKKVIVPESNIKESLEQVSSNLLASKNTKVLEQSIKRGDFPNLEKNTKPANLAKKNTQNLIANNKIEKTDSSQKKDIKDILKEIETSSLLDKKNLETSSQNSKKGENIPDAKQEQESRLNALALGVPGNPDVLDNIRDGEVTLLNAKADRFAVFVRRVALQVFNIMRTSNWYEVGDLANGFNTGEVTIIATLDSKGKYLNHEVTSSSGVPLFDKVISQSVRKGAWDRNPPQSALTNDGKIRFIFKSKAYVRGSIQGRSRQWIQLATGLE